MGMEPSKGGKRETGCVLKGKKVKPTVPRARLSNKQAVGAEKRARVGWCWGTPAPGEGPPGLQNNHTETR